MSNHKSLAVIVTAGVLFSACSGGGSSSNPAPTATVTATPSPNASPTTAPTLAPTAPSTAPVIGKWTASFGASDPEYPVFYTAVASDGSSSTIAAPVTFPTVPQSVTLIATQTGGANLPTSVLIAPACGNVVMAAPPSLGNPGSVAVTVSATIPANCTVTLRGASDAYAGNGAQFALR